ncbi:DoxX family protein [soil metagenome]
MKLFQQIDYWSDKHHPLILDFLRILLGVTIFLKGLYFISHTEELQQILVHSKFPWLSFAIAHYVALAHLAGGIMIAIGLFTRKAIALQIPILLGAVLFVNASKGFFSESPDLLFSATVLGMLCFFFFYGSGYLSADHTWWNEEHPQSSN